MDSYERRVHDLTEQVKEWREKVLRTPPESVSGSAFCRSLSDMLDRFLREIYELALERAMEKAGEFYEAGRTELALLATGGYGRREVCPFSDLDIAFVPSEEDNPFVDTLVRECFRLIVLVFMDNTDMKVGYGYRPLSDLPMLDTITQAALLDARFVAGYEPLAKELHRRLTEGLDVLRFLRDREKERVAAYRHHHETPFVVEPHLKEGAGGLRDYHTTLWLLAAHHRCPTLQAVTALVGLSREGIDLTAVIESVDFLRRLRNWLHLTAQRPQEVFLREYHHRFAEVWDKGEGGEEEKVRRLHARLYDAMETLHRTFRLVQETVWEGVTDLGDGFVREGQRLTVRGATTKGVLLLRAFALLQHYNLDPTPQLIRWLSQNAKKASEAWGTPEGTGAFFAVLTGKGDAPFGKVLHLFVETGVLEAFLPEWGGAKRYVPSNAAHRFTVGEHVLATVRELHRLREAAGRGEFPWVDVWNGVNDEEVLFLAALLHDLGKAVSEPKHEEVGVAIARAVGKRLGLSEDRANLLERLIYHHLLLLSTARLRDIYAPETAEAVAIKVKDEAFLKMLLLHSFADAKSVSAQTFTEVEERMVLDLYFSVLRLLQRREATDLQRLTRERIRELQNVLRERVSEAEILAFCDAMPPSYLLNTPLETIARHCSLVQRVRETKAPQVEVTGSLEGGFTEIVICAPDDPKPGMLSKIAGTLFACDADIRTAHVFTLPGNPPLVLDTLWVTSDARPLSEAKARRVRKALLAILKGKERLESFLQRQRKPVIVPVQVRSVRLRNDLSETHTVIHIVARDQKGLLYRLTREISALGLDIQTAKIATWGDVAEDAFYVLRKGDGKVPDEELKTLAMKLQKRLC